jgi:SsrA-binding protein
MSKAKKPNNAIALNKKASYEFSIETRYEAGICLEGWEIKSLRAGKIQLVDSYVLLKNNEAWLFGTQIPPLLSASTHVKPEPQRTRKLLLHRKEIDKLITAVQRDGYTVVPTKLYWSKGKVKLEIGLAKGKKQHDKRATEKDRDWSRDKARMMRSK